jgi:wyosine [tRNA(Phe)-imidazoG37] synthetase (radical SAM superfamily)
MKDRIRDVKHSLLFGPVPSRRLGVSLGVDLVPYKTCTMDCIYCESGCTTKLTLEREEFFPLEDVLAELGSYLDSDPLLDYITFSGAGEPTLYSRIGDVIAFIKNNYPKYKIALLTNGMLLSDPETFNDVKNVDLIVPSLDAADAEIFKKINRPVEEFDFSLLIDSFRRFHKESDAEFILEIFIVPGINDTPESLNGFAEAVKLINPDKVQLNSLDRPGAESWVPKTTEDGMKRVQAALAGTVEIEIVGKFISSESANSAKTDEDYKNIDQKIIDLISRRPATIDDFKVSLGYSDSTLNKVLHRLLEKSLITSEKSERGEFFSLKK